VIWIAAYISGLNVGLPRSQSQTVRIREHLDSEPIIQWVDKRASADAGNGCLATMRAERWCRRPWWRRLMAALWMITLWPIPRGFCCR